MVSHAAADTHAAALGLLFAWNSRKLSLGRQATTGVHQCFSPDAYAQLRAFQRSPRRSDAIIVPEMNPDGFEALHAIALVLRQVRIEDSSTT